MIVQIMSFYYLRPRGLQGANNQFHNTTNIAIQGSKFSMKLDILYGCI